MSRWIDADAFIDDLYEHEFSNWCDKDEVSTLVNDAPSIDIVRCGECKYSEESLVNGCVYCNEMDRAISEKGFCHRGERDE